MDGKKYGKWQPLRSLGAGGQGETYVALDTQRVNPEALVNSIADTVPRFMGIRPAGEKLVHAEQLAIALQRLAAKDDPVNQGALKVFYKPKDSAGYEKAVERMETEVRAYETVSHPNLLRLLNKDLTSGWIVTEYQPQGTLETHIDTRYRGNLLGALEALRPIVDAVAVLHSAGMVHRDIKPGNVFLSARGDLVLGDAGLVFFADEQHSRVSGTFENVGSRDWMPPWAMGMRVDDVRSSFDVFSLGKLLWSMVSGKRILRLWYHHKEEFELERMFPRDLDIRWARFVLDRCIVEEESDCLANAMDLLGIIDHAIRALRRGAQVIGESLQRLCTVCALGEYTSVDSVKTLGLNSVEGQSRPKIFACSHCGHTQIFYMGAGMPAAWRPKA